jgi:hypothetical protein
MVVRIVCVLGGSTSGGVDYLEMHSAGTLHSPPTCPAKKHEPGVSQYRARSQCPRRTPGAAHEIVSPQTHPDGLADVSTVFAVHIVCSCPEGLLWHHRRLHVFRHTEDIRPHHRSGRPDRWRAVLPPRVPHVVSRHCQRFEIPGSAAVSCVAPMAETATRDHQISWNCYSKLPSMRPEPCIPRSVVLRTPC